MRGLNEIVHINRAVAAPTAPVAAIARRLRRMIKAAVTKAKTMRGTPNAIDRQWGVVEGLEHALIAVTGAKR